MPAPPWAGEHHVCDECDLRYDDIDPEAVGADLRGLAANVRAVLDGADRAALAAHPVPDRWSAVEYLCHLRDVYIVTTIRLYRARTEQHPRLEPMLNDLRAVRFRYADCDPAPVLDDLDRVVLGCGDELTRVRDWDRTVERHPGEVRTCRWLARQAWHEGHHHLGDIGRLLS